MTQPDGFFLATGYGQLVTGLLLALIAALTRSTRLYALLATVLDDGGELPARHKPAPLALDAIPVSISSDEIVIDAEPVEPT